MTVLNATINNTHTHTEAHDGCIPIFIGSFVCCCCGIAHSIDWHIYFLAHKQHTVLKRRKEDGLSGERSESEREGNRINIICACVSVLTARCARRVAAWKFRMNEITQSANVPLSTLILPSFPFICRYLFLTTAYNECMAAFSECRRVSDCSSIARNQELLHSHLHIGQWKKCHGKRAEYFSPKYACVRRLFYFHTGRHIDWN